MRLLKLLKPNWLKVLITFQLMFIVHQSGLLFFDTPIFFRPMCMRTCPDAAQFCNLMCFFVPFPFNFNIVTIPYVIILYIISGILNSFKVIKWLIIFLFWAIPIGLMALARILWLILKPLLSQNQEILSTRIKINRLKFFIGGFIGTIFLASLYFFRHIPSGFEFYFLSADLSRQNTAFNIITAICTGLATIYGGIRHNQEAAVEARKRGIPENIIAQVGRKHIRTSVQNAIMLGLFAVWVTRLMPCSHDLSVLAFEALYLLSPITFDLLIPKSPRRMETANVPTNTT